MKRRVLFPVAIAPWILFAPVIFTGKSLFWGTVALQFFPWRWYAWEIVKSGHLPLWNPLSGMGAPLLANYQSALLYPPNWLFFALGAIGGEGWAAWSQGVLVCLHLAWAGVGMALLAQRLGQKELGQTVAGLAFGLSSYLVGRAGFLSMNAALAWLPWLLVAVTDLQSAIDKKDSHSHGRLRIAWQGGLLALCLALQLLTGHAQITWYSWLLVGLWAAFWAWNSAHSHNWDDLEKITLDNKIRASVWAILRLAAATAFACLLAAAQLFPTAEYLAVSQRSSEVGYEFASTYSFWPWRFLTLFAPDLFGNPARGDFWGYGNYWEDAVYVGLLPLLLGLGILIRTGFKWTARQKQQEGQSNEQTGENPNLSGTTIRPVAMMRFLLVILVCAFILALGKNTPVFPWLYRHFPTFDLFQAPTRWTIWVVFSLALLAGFGVDAWWRPQKRKLYWSRLAVAGAFAVTLGSGLAWYALQDISPTFLRAAALAGIWGIGCGLLNLTAPERTLDARISKSARFAQWWGVAVVVFIAGDLIFAGWGLNPSLGRSFYTTTNEVLQSEMAGLGNKRLFLPAEDEYRLKFDRFMQFAAFDPGEDWQNLRSALLPNLNLLHWIASVNNFDPLLPGRYEMWMSALEETNPGDRTVMLNLMAVGAVEHTDSSTASGVRFERVNGGERVRWVPCARYASSAENALKIVSEGQFDPNQHVVLEKESGSTGEPCGPPVTEAKARIGNQNPNYVAVEVDAPSAGWLVLGDTWYPGWAAKVDGKDVEIIRANYLYRAVPVGAGEHTVEFKYQPVSFGAGSIVAIIAWIALVAMLVFARKESSRRGSQ